jgi:enolase-phosphatase E1
MMVLAKARAVVLDIEGTMVPIEFVYQKLFPYARARMERFLREHERDAECEAALCALVDQNRCESSQEAPKLPARDAPHFLTAARGYLEWLMDGDSKCGPLKTIQGLIWNEGFDKGELSATVFDDVPTALKRWHERGVKVAIYSSGSTLAQKLILSHTQVGDLTPFINYFFDTRVGPKKVAASYRCIGEEIDISVSDTLFISDSVDELKAAAEIGLHTLLSVRPGNAVVPAHHDFEEIASWDRL